MTGGFATRREKFALEAFVGLRDEERRSPKHSLVTDFGLDLVIQEALYVVDRQQMLAVH